MTNTELIKLLIEDGTFNYGAIWHQDDFTNLFGLELPDYSRCKNDEEKFRTRDNYKIKVMAIVDLSRKHLLKQGMYIAQTGEDVSIPLASQTEKYIDSYNRKGKENYRRANVLYKSYGAKYPPDTNQETKQRSASASQIHKEHQTNRYQHI